MQTLAQAAKAYQNLCKQVHRLDSEMDKVRQQHHQLRNQKNKIQDELRTLKNLIDHCVITGESPSQALLSHTREQIENLVIQHNNSLNQDTLYIDTGMITINSLSTTSVAAIGSTSWHDHTITTGTSGATGV